VQLFELGFRLQLPGPLRSLSRRHPDVEWSVRPLGGRWLAEEGRPEPGSAPGSGRVVLLPRSSGERAWLREIEAWDATLLPPVLVRSGVLTARLLSQRPTPPDAWRRRHPDLELVAKRQVRPGASGRAVDGGTPWALGLTDRQREALRRAVADGYYDVPRRVTVADLARSLSLGRSTVEEHLRAAESAVVRAAAPIAVGPARTEVLPDAGESAAWRTYARFSAELHLYVWMWLHGERIASVAMRPDPSPDADARHPYLDRILRHVRTGAGDLKDLPVELNVSAFERRVLEETRRIPTGRTASYADVARRIGAPNAARAVGNALARNPVPLVIPCHRVVPVSGGIGRYSGGEGPPTKATLLAREGARVRSDDAMSVGPGAARAPARTGGGGDPTGGATWRRPQRRGRARRGRRPRPRSTTASGAGRSAGSAD
jgi:O-6-methylguanine DNA methyltransferase